MKKNYFKISCHKLFNALPDALPSFNSEENYFLKSKLKKAKPFYRLYRFREKINKKRMIKTLIGKVNKKQALLKNELQTKSSYSK